MHLILMKRNRPGDQFRRTICGEQLTFNKHEAQPVTDEQLKLLSADIGHALVIVGHDAHGVLRPVERTIEGPAELISESPVPEAEIETGADDFDHPVDEPVNEPAAPPVEQAPAVDSNRNRSSRRRS